MIESVMEFVWVFKKRYSYEILQEVPSYFLFKLCVLFITGVNTRRKMMALNIKF